MKGLCLRFEGRQREGYGGREREIKRGRKGDTIKERGIEKKESRKEIDRKTEKEGEGEKYTQIKDKENKLRLIKNRIKEAKPFIKISRKRMVFKINIQITQIIRITQKMKDEKIQKQRSSILISG